MSVSLSFPPILSLSLSLSPAEHLENEVEEEREEWD